MPQTQYPQYQPATPPRTHRRSLWDKTWKDRNGRYAIWQTPNVWLIGWAVLTTLSLFFTRTTGSIMAGVAAASLIVWSLLEIFRGVNYFRRLLGLIVIIYAITALIRAF
jgi:hypothetical protein